MLTVLACITEAHDLGLVIIAGLVCLAGAWATMRLFLRAMATTASERLAWLTLTAVAAGAAIWCTHFIAMLGHHPGVPIGFDPVLTIVSLLVAMLGAFVGFAVAALRGHRLAPATGGALVGAAIAVMHYTGMLAYRVQGIVFWDQTYLIASVLLSVAFSALALHVAVHRPRSIRHPLAPGLFVLAIVCLHFTGMTAFQVEPLLIEGNFSNPEALRALALAVAAVTIPVVGAGAASQLIDHRARAVAAEALSHMSNGLVIVDREGMIRLFNERALILLNLDPASLRIGMPGVQFLRLIGSVHGWDEERITRSQMNLQAWRAQGSSVRFEHAFANGTVLNIDFQPMPDGGAILSYDDVTEARRGQRLIAHMAFHDALTGLPNRRSFDEHLAGLSREGPFVMLMLDLDRFKVVNDTLGHAVGDGLLVAVARRLREGNRAPNRLYRLGGDELATAGMMTQAEAESWAQVMIACFSRPFDVAGQSISIGLSIGIALAPQGENPEHVQRMADLALYKAKANGRGRAETYSMGMLEELTQRRQFENDLARAVQAGELALHYQPLHALPGRRLVGFEALLRWQHPTRGQVPPAEFIPIAEQCGAIAEIGAWVIDEACRQASLWPSELYVSINVSPVQLRSPRTLEEISQALARHQLRPRRIEVEITETAMTENDEEVARNLAGLRQLGVRIAIDDFGTGYSSLTHLRDYTVDRIKIDRSFVSASASDRRIAAVVRAISNMAREMGVATTGEGVETEEQLKHLVDCGCGTAQGYLLGRPVDAKRATGIAETALQGQTGSRKKLSSEIDSAPTPA